jgi:hypothetical protein
MTAINGLQQTDPTANIAAGNKVFFEPAVLTVRGKSQYRDDEISFVEISNFWSLPQNFVYNDAPRQPGTNPSDGNLHPGDVCTFTLNLNPKRGQNAKPGAFYANIGSVTGANGQQPIAAQQAAPQQAHSEQWGASDEYNGAGEHVQTTQPTLPVDQRIAKAQAWNGLTAMLAAEQRNGNFTPEQLEPLWDEWWAGYEALKAGRTPFTEAEPAVEDEESPAEELDQQAQQHMAEIASKQPPPPAARVGDDQVESIPW